ncbi:MAG: hypothetical protein CL930_04905 [Deltaproteobacteria bacterium]|nr:hypothetical protein [Deltaproteobacteria bacterium]
MKWLLVLAMWSTSVAHAQVNIEKLRSVDLEDGLSGSVGLSTALSTGNVQFADFTGTAHMEFKKDKDLLFWIMNGRFAAKRTQSDLLEEPSISLWDEEAHFSNLMLQHIRYNRAINDKFWWELYAQYEYNEFLLLDRRVLGGSGPRLALLDAPKGGMWAGTSAMLESERLNPEGIAPSQSAEYIDVRWSTYITGTLTPSDTTTWVTTIYIQPRIQDFADYRFSAETGLNLKVNKKLSFSLDAKLRHDETPPVTPDGSAEVLTTDMRVSNGLKVSW